MVEPEAASYRLTAMQSARHLRLVATAPRLPVLLAATVVVAGACVAAVPAASGPAASGAPGVVLQGRVTAGPTCPVERMPPDPSCAPRNVGGAVIVVRSAGGVEVGRTTSASTGSWSITLAPGTYAVVAQPVAGIIGTPAAATVTLSSGEPAVTLDLSYDTGIR